MNLLDEWWDKLNLDEKTEIVCNFSKSCGVCPLLKCEDCNDLDKVRLFAGVDKEDTE